MRGRRESFSPLTPWGKAMEDALWDVKAEGCLVLAPRETGLTPLVELDVLTSGGVAVSARRQGQGTRGLVV